MVVDCTYGNRRDGVTTGVARFVKANGVEGVHVGIQCQAILEAGKHRARIGDDAKGTGRVGSLRGPPIGDFTLQGRVVFKHECIGGLCPERFGLQDPVIEILAEYCHALAVAVSHRPVHFFHPDACGRCQHTTSRGTRTDHSAEHALHVGCFEVGDGCCAIVGKGEPIAFGSKAAVCCAYWLGSSDRTPAGHHTSGEEEACQQYCYSVVHSLHGCS